MPRASNDVLIIGAGAAGLAAAAELARAGCTGLVLEARDRVGGRCWSLREPSLQVPIELGAEFIHGRPAATLALLEESGTAAVDVTGDPWILRRGRLVPRRNVFRQVQSAMRTAGPLRRDVSFAAYLARTLSRELPQSALDFARMLAEGYDAADPERASARAIIGEWTSTGLGGDQYRPLGGYSALLDHLKARLAATRVRLRLESVVTAVRWKRGAVEVHGRSRGRPFRITAARAAVTLPLGVLQCQPGAPGAVQFVPPLKQKEQALNALAAGPVIKVVLRFRSPVWESLARGRFRDASFLHTPRSPFPTFWTGLPVRAPLITAWAGGPRAARFASASRAEIVRSALASLESIFGGHALLDAQLQSAHVHDWQCDPFARGAYAYDLVGANDARALLATPLRDTLFFAGEATDIGGEAATVAGALQSGLRAAHEILAALN